MRVKKLNQLRQRKNTTKILRDKVAEQASTKGTFAAGQTKLLHLWTPPFLFSPILRNKNSALIFIYTESCSNPGMWYKQATRGRAAWCTACSIPSSSTHCSVLSGPSCHPQPCTWIEQKLVAWSSWTSMPQTLNGSGCTQKCKQKPTEVSCHWLQ